MELCILALDDGGLSNWGSYVEAFNATTGSFIWRYGKVYTMSPPAVVNGVVYISGNFSVFALNAATGQQIWRYVTNWTAGTPTVNNGVVYVGCNGPGGMEANRFFALNAASGELIWNFSLRDDPKSPAAVYDGVVYLNVGGTEGRLYAIDATDGQELWSYPQLSVAHLPLRVALFMRALLIVVFTRWTLRLGSVCWTFNVTGQQWISGTSPAVSNHIVYTSSGNGSVYALNAADGTIVWSYTTQGVWNNYTYPVAGSFAIASGTVAQVMELCMP